MPVHVAEQILAVLDAIQETGIRSYCGSCMWTSEANRNLAKCNALIPTCGGNKKNNNCHRKLAFLVSSFWVGNIVHCSFLDYKCAYL